MAIVVRVENADHVGPYIGDVLDGYPHPAHPVPEQDGIPDVGMNDLFGFKDLVQMLNWFDNAGDLWELQCYEYRVNLVFVEDHLIRYGENQLVFHDTEDEPHPRIEIPWAEVIRQLESKLAVPTETE